jgi:hypothetical protein
MLPTNLLDMVRDPYLEDRQLAAPKEIVDLVERFKRNLLEYKASTYNEAQTRQEFINPFFQALGWDMCNVSGSPERYKEVLCGSCLDLESTTLTPDYTFRVDGNIKFLIEAKKPFVNLNGRANPAYQLRSYAWHAKLPISIITNFKEFALYDCRYQPKRTDDVNTARIVYIEYTDYISSWDWISNKFSKPAIQRGCLDNPEKISSWKKEFVSEKAKQMIAIRQLIHSNTNG